MSTFREVQLKGYEILNQVIDICEKHDLTYYLSSGTLLGAIRHDGFIPWDNDIDIEMPVKDYRLFLKIAEKELPDNLFLQTYYTDPGYNEMWAKVRDNGTTSLPIAWKNLDINWGVGIDIFPLVGIYDNPLLRKMQIKLHSICRLLLAKDFLLAINAPDLSRKKLQILYFLPKKIRIAICRIFECFIFRNPGADNYLSMVHSTIDYPVKHTAYGSGMKKMFETREFTIPCDYQHILSQLYGDYMTPPPESERNGHEGILGKIIYDCEKSYKEYLDRD